MDKNEDEVWKVELRRVEQVLKIRISKKRSSGSGGSWSGQGGRAVTFEERLDKRWTAFTEEELNTLLDGLRQLPYTPRPIPRGRLPPRRDHRVPK